MATYYLYEGRLTKPAGTTWFSTYYPTESAERVNALKALNLADPWIKTVEDDNNYSYQLYFQSFLDFSTFVSYSSSLTSSEDWHLYNNANGIVETILYSGYVEVDPVTLPASNN
jgi:hypothetical protein